MMVLILHKIIRNRILILVLNAVFIAAYHVKVVQDEISTKTAPIWLHHTVDFNFIFNAFLYVMLSKRN